MLGIVGPKRNLREHVQGWVHKHPEPLPPHQITGQILLGERPTHSADALIEIPHHTDARDTICQPRFALVCRINANRKNACELVIEQVAVTLNGFDGAPPLSVCRAQEEAKEQVSPCHSMKLKASATRSPLNEPRTGIAREQGCKAD